MLQHGYRQGIQSAVCVIRLNMGHDYALAENVPFALIDIAPVHIELDFFNGAHQGIGNIIMESLLQVFIKSNGTILLIIAVISPVEAFQFFHDHSISNAAVFLHVDHGADLVAQWQDSPDFLLLGLGELRLAVPVGGSEHQIVLFVNIERKGHAILADNLDRPGHLFRRRDIPFSDVTESLSDSFAQRLGIIIRHTG